MSYLLLGEYHSGGHTKLRVVALMYPQGCVAIREIRLTAQKPSKIPQNPRTISEHIKKRRLELGMAQLAVSQILSVKESTIIKWEKNRTSFMLNLLPKIIAFLNYNPETPQPDTLGEKIRAHRQAHGLGQKRLAQLLDIGRFKPAYL